MTTITEKTEPLPTKTVEYFLVRSALFTAGRIRHQIISGPMDEETAHAELISRSKSQGLNEAFFIAEREI